MQASAHLTRIQGSTSKAGVPIGWGSITLNQCIKNMMTGRGSLCLCFILGDMQVAMWVFYLCFVTNM